MGRKWPRLTNRSVSMPTLVVHSGSGGLEDLRYGKAHVQLCQRQLIHNIRQLETENTGQASL